MSDPFSVVSIIIPVLDEQLCLDATLNSVRELPGSYEIIVVDGGSADRSMDVARSHPVKVLATTPNRGCQLHFGSAAASGEILWFLHADTIPSRDALHQIERALQDPSVIGGCFDVGFDSDARAARFLTHVYRGFRHVGLCYGDSAIFIRADAYRECGGFRALPLFEDIDLLRRIKKKGRFVHLQGQVITSSRRFQGRSFTLTFAKWCFLQVLYWAGFNPVKLNRMYAPIRQARMRT